MPSSAEQPLRDRPDGHARRGLPRRRALEHVAHVVQPVLHDARQIGVAWPRQLHLAAAARGDLGQLLLGDRPGAHSGAPVGVVAVAHDQRERPAEREPVPHPAEDLDVVRLDLLPRTAPVSRLPAPEIGPDRLAVEREPRGQPGDHRGDPGTVRLPGRDVAQLHRSERSERASGQVAHAASATWPHSRRRPP